ncbi:hypothetical protein MSAN_01846200 [Mycena sanguinolenta]|uniref:Xylanolytic transcriptional activator regulatory domain-containing protein n=1 Tax=Mycena sanguinolenta TaxID=230812 RepID=A0A8H6XRJ9_9AGAR|nr:hypothetical protein MSAN_01846200 [Mycena sanguinolenta]
MQFPSSEPSSSSVQQPGLSLPTPSMQNQIHELAKTSLPPPRKQNTACDACRSRKVKCNRLPGQDKAMSGTLFPPVPQHPLMHRDPALPEHYVQQATSEKKRTSTLSRRPRNLSSARYVSLRIPVPLRRHPSTHHAHFPRIIAHQLPEPGPGLQRCNPSPTSENGIPTAQQQQLPVASHNIPLLVKYGFYPPITLKTPTREVLSYVFAPPENASLQTPYAPWGELAPQLEDDTFRAEFALDLVEVFFQIVHTRIPLLNPSQFRNQLHLHPGDPPNPESALHPALVATVLAWGTKFSEHPLLVADRRRPGGQSLLAKTLIDRARNLAEALKVHRIPSPDHVVIGLLLEPLQSQNPDDPDRFHCFWVGAATRHLLDLQVNHKAVLTTISDPDARGTMIFAFWMACIADAYGSVYYRHKPVLDDDDYDIDFYTVDPINPDVDSSQPTPDPREQLEFLGYYRAAHALARVARQMSRNLWRPVTDADGVPFDVLYMLTTALSVWRDEYLTVVGVPSNFEGEWDFVSAVSSCASDATYHVMWVVLFNALDDFGIKEINEVTRMNQPLSMVQNYQQIDLVKRKVADEALHGALRIAGLAGVLTSNGYLRLDPAVMLVSCIQSGNLLARLGRPEVSNCITGLEQYSYSYEEAGEQAAEMRRTYNQVRAGELELQHMASVAPRMPYDSQDQGMLVDEQQSPHQSPHQSVSPHHHQSVSPHLGNGVGIQSGLQSPNAFESADYAMYAR